MITQVPDESDPLATVRGRLDQALVDGVHTEVSASEAGIMFLKPPIDVNEYKGQLLRLYSWYREADARLASFSPLDNVLRKFGVSVRDFVRTDLLAADLKFLGVSDLDLCGVQTFQGIPKIETLEDAVAILYVGTGWEVRSEAVAEKLITELGYHAGHGGSFFDRSYRQATRNLQALIGLMEEDLAESPMERRLQNTAMRTLAQMISCFRHPLEGSASLPEGRVDVEAPTRTDVD